MKMKKWLSISLTAALAFTLAACQGKDTTNPPQQTEGSILDKDFTEILEEAKGTTVTFYGWGGSDQTNGWIDNYLTPAVKEAYDINVERVGMDIDEILNILLNEKQAGKENGDIDVIWINGENFTTAMDNELLFGPFVDKLPNFQNLVDTTSLDVLYDFGKEINGYEAPYGKAQFVMEYNSEYITNPPTSAEELLEWAKQNPGKFTYTALPDFTSSAFVRNILYELVGYEQFLTMEPDEEVVREAIQPLIDYLKELKPYLWNKGVTYPGDGALLQNMFIDGEVWMHMSYNPFSAQGKVENNIYPDTVKTFIFDKGTIGNTHFVAIPQNSDNKAGAMALINFILSAEAQATKYVPATWGDLPVVDNSKLTEEEKALFEVEIGDASLPQSELMDKRLPEMPANLVPIIEKIWAEEIPGE